MDNIQQEINVRIDRFVSEITDLARKVAYETLSSALDHDFVGALDGRRMSMPASPHRRKSGKRSPNEIAETAETLFEYISANPGQRMEAIARAMGASTKDLTLPIKKLLQTERVQVEGQKRATTYYPAMQSDNGAPKTKPRRRGRRKRA